MFFIRNHWFDIGFLLAILIVVLVFIGTTDVYGLQYLIWLNFIALLLHQFEEYRFPGYFPGMLNSVIFKSSKPDRYPLNTNSALVINVYLGWTVYFLSAVLYDKIILLAFVTMLISSGNFIAHTFIFNIKAKTFYNPGMITAIILFLPVSILFFFFIFQYNVLTTFELVIGLIIGIIINVYGLVKLILLMKNENTKYAFEESQLLPDDRKTQ